MLGGSLARRYARALIGLAAEKDGVDAYAQELAHLAAAFRTEPALAEVLDNRFVADTAKKNIVTALAERLALGEDVKRLLGIVVAKGRATQLEGISQAYLHMADDQAGRIRACLTSAVALEQAQTLALRDQLAKLTGCEVILTSQVDENLVGGLKVTMGGVVYDGSVRGELEKMRQILSD